MDKLEIIDTMMGFIVENNLPISDKALCRTLDYVEREGIMSVAEFMEDSLNVETEYEVKRVNEGLQIIVDLAIKQQNKDDVESRIWDEYIKGTINLGVDNHGQIVAM